MLGSSVFGKLAERALTAAARLTLDRIAADRPALAAGGLPLAVLRRVREHLERLRRDPAVRFQSKA